MESNEHRGLDSQFLVQFKSPISEETRNALYVLLRSLEREAGGKCEFQGDQHGSIQLTHFDRKCSHHKC